VLAATGSMAILARLRELKVAIDSNAKSLEIKLSKLLLGRGDAAIGFEIEGRQLMARPEYAGKVEMLGLPLAEEAYYLAVSRDYYKRNRDAVEKMWRVIGRLGASAQFQPGMAAPSSAP
jgi:polar amino acid transport system substrate-binding protein